MKEHYKRDELVDVLIDELEDELEGIISYDKLYDSLIAHKMHEEAEVIESIAGQEYKHACALWDMLNEMDVDLSMHEKIQSDWDCVKKIFNI